MGKKSIRKRYIKLKLKSNTKVGEISAQAVNNAASREIRGKKV